MDLLKQNNISWDVFFEPKAKLLQYDGVAQVIDLHNFCNTLSGIFLHNHKNGINPKRSGDIFFILEPILAHFIHQLVLMVADYEYDSHVPLIFYGWNLKPNPRSSKLPNITDIAPTIAAMLHILAPNGNIGTIDYSYRCHEMGRHIYKNQNAG